MELPAVSCSQKTVMLAPLGDIQWTGASGTTAERLLRQHIAEALSYESPTTVVRFLGMGDYVDFASPSNRDRLRAANLYDTAKEVIEDKAKELATDLYERILKPTTGRWLGLLQGHHYADLAVGGTTDTHLCMLLKARFLGDCVSYGLRFYRNGHKGTVEIWAHHGAGSGRTDHAPLLRLAQLAAKHEADLFLMGHLHREAFAKLDRTYVMRNETREWLQHREIRLVGTGGWLKGYVESRQVAGRAQGTYVERAMLPPVAIGAPLILIEPRWESPVVPGKGRRPSGGRRQTHQWAPKIRVIA